MALDLFAGIPVGDYPAALAWYERLFGAPPTFFPNDTEAVWELSEHRSVYVAHRPEHAGHAMATVIVDDLDALVARVADHGVTPSTQETYSNGVRKVTYHDPEGNEIGFGAVAGPSGGVPDPFAPVPEAATVTDDAGDLNYDEAHGGGDTGPHVPGRAV